MMTNDISSEIAEKANFAIQRAKKAGIDGSFVNSQVGRAFSTRFANSAIHQNFTDLSTEFEITVIKGKKQVGVGTNSLNESDISWAVDRAVKMVSFLPDDPEFPGILTEKQQYPELRLNDPKARDLSPLDVADRIISGIDAGHDYSRKVQSVSGNLNLLDGISYFLSSEGLEKITPITEITSTINVMSDDGSGESRSNSTFGGRRFDEIPLISEAEAVAERSVLGLNAQELEPKAYPVVLDFQAASDIIFFLGYALSGRIVLDQRSFLKDKMGEKAFTSEFTLNNAPHDPKLLAARPLDMEGVATQEYTLIDGGVVKNFAHSRVTASKMGTKSNGCGFIFMGNSFPFPFALDVEPGKKKRQQLINDLDNGLLVTNLHYSNFIDMSRGTITGMTKDGVFIVKNGEILGAAKNMRYTDSVPNLLASASFSSERFQATSMFSGIGLNIPAVSVESMSFSSKAGH